MESFNDDLATFNDGLWLYLVVPVLAALCLYFTVRSGAVQIRLLPDMFRSVVGKSAPAPGQKPVSSFQAFAISAAARIGTGNIVGVATAIALGGPGAVFWMWVMGLVVGAASFVESTLAQLYKVRDGKDFRGGPAYYMERGLGKRWMGLLFSVVIIVTFSFVFNSVQANTISGRSGRRPSRSWARRRAGWPRSWAWPWWASWPRSSSAACTASRTRRSCSCR
ncbi:alanine:cation symporter family protein [Isoptericola sp. NPDC019693]|uniref:alanine:cation symporter family protein n=1 Tax=Isoptericola sp. NPDC019693 TaxID=3364009 RepID=UPI00379CF39E